MKTLTAATALCALTLSAPAQAEAVVVSSTAPGLALGQVVADGASVVLPEDATATFLLSSGQILRLMGPYHGPVSAQQASGGARLALLDGHDLSALGGVRSARTPRLDALRAPVRIDAVNGGTYCVAANTPITLVRGRAAPVQVTLDGAGRATTVRWSEDATDQPWPTTLPAEARYTLRWPGETPRDLTFRRVDDEAGNDAALVANMAAAGCTSQVAPLLRALGEQTTPLALWLGTERGRAPRYAPGEEMTVVLQTNRDAHVYCYSVGPDGLAGVSPSGLDGGFAVPGNTVVRLSARRLPGGPPELPGEQRQLRCWATEAEVSDHLPRLLASSSSDEASRRLEAAFDNLSAVQTAEARLVLRVE